MVPFAGYNMPVQYEGVNIEHETVRNGVGVFDVSHMGEFLITGAGALDLIQRVTSNDASVLTVGRAQYSCLPNNEGGIVDDLIVYRMKEEQYLLVVNASNIEKACSVLFFIKRHFHHLSGYFVISNLNVNGGVNCCKFCFHIPHSDTFTQRRCHRS